MSTLWITVATWGMTALAGVLAGWLANRAADVLPVLGNEAGAAVAGARWRYRPLALAAAIMTTFLLGRARFAGQPAALAAFWFYATYFWAVVVIDLEHRRVLNIMLAPAAGIALLLAARHGWPAVGNAVLGGAVGLAVFLVVAFFSRGKLGAGDVKLAGVIGLATGYPAVLSALLVGVFLAGAVIALLMLGGRIGLKSYIAYAPYLALGALVVLFLAPVS
ncbi:MAG: A24 family peptidase [Anaerolineae bacterium]|nr:A24 family peptidase [Anaerolineae bacterium]